MSVLTEWIRRREGPVADRLYRTAKRIQVIDMPVLPVLHLAIYKTHQAIVSGLINAFRVFYWTPVFRSRLLGSNRRLHIAGFGMPLVTGSVDISIGDDCRVSNAMTISGRGTSSIRPRLNIGNNVGIGWQTTIAVGSRVIMEDNVRIGGRAFFAGYPGHPTDPHARAMGLPDTDEQVGDIVLRRDVWLGTGCTVSAGVEIGAETIVAAGSVVVKSLPTGVLAAGVPARIIRTLDRDRDAETIIELKEVAK